MVCGCVDTRCSLTIELLSLLTRGTDARTVSSDDASQVIVASGHHRHARSAGKRLSQR